MPATDPVAKLRAHERIAKGLFTHAKDWFVYFSGNLLVIFNNFSKLVLIIV